MDFSVQSEHYQQLNVGHIAIIKISGPLNQKSVQILEAAVNENYQKGICRIILDMSDTRYVNSTGLGLFINIAHKAKLIGGGVRLINIAEKFKVLLDMIGLGGSLPISKTKEEALHSFGEGEVVDSSSERFVIPEVIDSERTIKSIPDEDDFLKTQQEKKTTPQSQEEEAYSKKKNKKQTSLANSKEATYKTAELEATSEDIISSSQDAHKIDSPEESPSEKENSFPNITFEGTALISEEDFDDDEQDSFEDEPDDTSETTEDIFSQPSLPARPSIKLNLTKNKTGRFLSPEASLPEVPEVSDDPVVSESSEVSKLSEVSDDSEIPTVPEIPEAITVSDTPKKTDQFNPSSPTILHSRPKRTQFQFVAKYYSQMLSRNPYRLNINLNDIQIASDNPKEDIQNSSIILIPRLPGCQVVPDKLSLDLNGRTPPKAEFWITPLCQAGQSPGWLEIWYGGKTQELIKMPFRVSDHENVKTSFWAMMFSYILCFSWREESFAWLEYIGGWTSLAYSFLTFFLIFSLFSYLRAVPKSDEKQCNLELEVI